MAELIHKKKILPWSGARNKNNIKKNPRVIGAPGLKLKGLRK